MAYQHFKNLDDKKMVACFQKYMEHGGSTVSRAEFEAKLHAKLGDNAFLEDIQPLLRPGTAKFKVQAAGDLIKQRTLALIHGDPWNGIQRKVK